MSAVAPEQCGDVGTFLNGLRRRLSSATPTLGEFDRVESRRGKRISQEEIAEAVGVSRGWYQRLESGAIRPSISLLDRLAAALNATPEERETLFRLAIPALSNRFTTTTAQAFESLSFVRAVSSQLWAASSECEALTVVGEHLAKWFNDASFIVPVRRLDAGHWKWWFAADGGQGTAWSECVAEICRLTTTQQCDEFWSYPRLQSPGETVDHAEHEQCIGDLRHLAAETHQKHGVDVSSFLRSRITTRSGLIACIQINHRRDQTYSDIDRAAVAAVAELTSLALS